MPYIFYILALLTGVAMSIQSGVNAGLRQGVGSPLLAAVISFGTGFLALILVQLSVGNPAPTLETMRQISWWKWIGGLIGACYVTTVIVTITKIGPGNLLSLSVAGQLIAAIVLDHYGLLGFAPHPANTWRLLGVLLIIGGVILVVRN